MVQQEAIVAFEQCAEICRDGGGSGSEWSAVFRRLAQRQGSRYLNFATFRHIVITFTKQPTFERCAWARASPHFLRVSPLRFRLDFTAVHPLWIVDLFTAEAGHILTHHRATVGKQMGPVSVHLAAMAAAPRPPPPSLPPGYCEFGARALVPADAEQIRHRALRLSVLLAERAPALGLLPEPEPEPEPEAEADEEDHEGGKKTASASVYWRHRWRTWLLRMRS
jgi:hypothetical protein